MHFLLYSFQLSDPLLYLYTMNTTSMTFTVHQHLAESDNLGAPVFAVDASTDELFISDILGEVLYTYGLSNGTLLSKISLGIELVDLQPALSP